MELPLLSSLSYFFFILLFSLVLPSGAQQSYINDEQLACYMYNNSVTGGNLCNGPQRSCVSYLTFRSLSPYDTAISIGYLLGATATMIAKINNITEVDTIPTGTLILVPVNCSCSGKFYQYNTSYTLKDGRETYFSVANNTYNGLTTCQALMNQNPYDSRNLSVGLSLLVPLRCACPTRDQTSSGVRFLLTYLVTWSDSVSSIGETFGVDEQSINAANGLVSAQTIFAFTPILVPLKIQPRTRTSESPPPLLQPSNPSSVPASRGPSTAPTSIAKEGCPERCGNISIPYPFGIGGECYYNKMFNILCNQSNSNPPVPFLQYSNLEVLEFLPDYSVRVVYNSVASTCNGNSNKEIGVDLPFTFSSTYNNFTAVGCDISAFYAPYNNNKNGADGCMSACSKIMHTMNTGSFCANVSCCKRPIPSRLTRFDVEVSNFNVASNSCGIAFLADTNFSEYNQFNQSNSMEVLNSARYRVPVVLDWVIETITCEEARKGRSIGDGCGKNSQCVESVDGPGYQCQCSKGFQGNPYLPNGCKGSKPRIPLVLMLTSGIGIALTLATLVATSLWLYTKFVKRRQIKLKQKFFKKNGGLLLQQQISSHDHSVEKIKIFPIEELDRATDNFNGSRILGNGGFGTVYKGMLSDGRIVAIKKSKIVDEIQIDQFINEVVILAQINHRNIVKLLGCCLETEVPLLVYEFVLNGTLSYHLHAECQASSLSWENRLKIAAEIAGALAYLHSAASKPIFHRDIKSTNILLDENYRAKVADFGISRTVPFEKTHLTTLVQGTFGYLDPEYFNSGQYTEKSDVYSFGVVLLEILTGQKAISVNGYQGERSLTVHFVSSMKENRLFEILEARVIKEGHRDQLLAISKLAKKCVKMNGKKRPAMKEAAAVLEGLRSFSKTSLNTCVDQYRCLKFEEDALSYPIPIKETGSAMCSSNSSTCLEAEQYDNPISRPDGSI